MPTNSPEETNRPPAMPDPGVELTSQGPDEFGDYLTSDPAEIDAQARETADAEISKARETVLASYPEEEEERLYTPAHEEENTSWPDYDEQQPKDREAFSVDESADLQEGLNMSIPKEEPLMSLTEEPGQTRNAENPFPSAAELAKKNTQVTKLNIKEGTEIIGEPLSPKEQAKIDMERIMGKQTTPGAKFAVEMAYNPQYVPAIKKLIETYNSTPKNERKGTLWEYVHGNMMTQQVASYGTEFGKRYETIASASLGKEREGIPTMEDGGQKVASAETYQQTLERQMRNEREARR